MPRGMRGGVLSDLMQGPPTPCPEDRRAAEHWGTVVSLQRLSSPPVPLRTTSTRAASLFALASLVAGCRSATEIVLDVRTDVPCASPASWQGIAISVGEPGVDVESRAPVLTTTACPASGEVGSLVVVPTGAKNAEVGIRVVAGITRKPEDCAANGYDGCIVSRRTLTYLPHQSEQVVVDLTSDCIGNACDINHTCVDGSCTDTVTATPPVAPDGGVVAGPTVRCGDDGMRCPANDPSLVCCVTFDYEAGTGTGDCVAPAACPSTSAALYCDDSSECEAGDAGDPVMCCESIGGSPYRTTNAGCQAASTCDQGQGLALVLCQYRQACPVNQATCGLDPNAPGYFDCTAR